MKRHGNRGLAGCGVPQSVLPRRNASCRNRANRANRRLTLARSKSFFASWASLTRTISALTAMLAIIEHA